MLATTKTMTTLTSSSSANSNKSRPSPYLERVEEALSRSFSKMEPYENNNIVTASNNKKVATVKRGACSIFRPHVELGTAPIEVEHIEDIQKIRPFRASNIANTKTPSTGSTNNKTAFGVRNGTASTTKNRTAAAAATTTATTTKKKESCLIESTSNSVRVSFLFKAQAKLASTSTSTSTDPLEASILFQWMRFLQQQAEDHYQILRRKPLEGYSVTFLVTNKHLAIHGRHEVEHTILDFCSRIDKECSDIKIQVNAQARYITTEFCKAFNQTDD